MMKEILYKKVLSRDKKRKFVSSCETLEEKGRRVEVYKNCLYNIKEEENFQDSSEVESFISRIQNSKEVNQIYIKRIIDTTTGNFTISYIVKGSIFALVKNKLYRISFKQEHILESRPL